MTYLYCASMSGAMIILNTVDDMCQEKIIFRWFNSLPLFLFLSCNSLHFLLLFSSSPYVQRHRMKTQIPQIIKVVAIHYKAGEETLSRQDG